VQNIVILNSNFGALAGATAINLKLMIPQKLLARAWLNLFLALIDSLMPVFYKKKTQ